MVQNGIENGLAGAALIDLHRHPENLVLHAVHITELPTVDVAREGTSQRADRPAAAEDPHAFTGLLRQRLVDNAAKRQPDCRSIADRASKRRKEDRRPADLLLAELAPADHTAERRLRTGRDGCCGYEGEREDCRPEGTTSHETSRLPVR